MTFWELNVYYQWENQFYCAEKLREIFKIFSL